MTRMSEQDPPSGDPQNPYGGAEPTNPYQTGGDRPSWSSQQPADPTQAYGQPYGGQPYGGAYVQAPDHPQSTTVLVLGILSLVLCQILGPFAWVMGNRVVREIDASNGSLGGRSGANAGRICGIIATVLFVLAIVGVALVLVVAIASVSTSSS